MREALTRRADYTYLGVAVSGATTIATSIAFSLNQVASATNVGGGLALVFGGGGGGGPGAFTPGSNTFTAQLRNFSGASSVSASNVLLTVIPLN